MQKTLTITSALAALALIGSQTSYAQTPPAPPAHHGFLHNLLHRPKPGQTATLHPMTHGHFMKPGHPVIATRPTMGGHMMGGHPMGGALMGGSIIGNKNSHVYHLPGDKGALPAAQNRVYFRSAAAAEAAGYHASGSGVKSHRTMHSTMH